MKADFVNPFLTAAVNVFKSIMGVAPEMGKLGARRGVFTSQQCNVVFGVTGELEGQIIFGMTLFAADKIASEMLMAPVLTFNELAASAIAEMGNMISGGALTGLSAVGYKCWLSPPSLIRGTKVQISTLDIPTLVVPLITKVGEIEINISLAERKKIAA